MARPEFFEARWQRPIENDQSSARSQCRPGRAKGARRIAQLVERVLKVGQVVLARAAGLTDVAVADVDPVGQSRGIHIVAGPSQRIRLKLQAHQFKSREAPGHGDQPSPAAAMDVDDAAAARQVCHELWQLGQHLLEEDGDILNGQPFDRDSVAIGPLGRRLAGPEEVQHAGPVQRGDDRVDELSTEKLRACFVEEDHGRFLVEDQAIALELRQAVRIGRRDPCLDWIGLAITGRREVSRGQPVPPSSSKLSEQAKLDAEIDEPGPMKAGQAVDEILEAVVELHPGRIVAWQSGVAPPPSHADATVRRPLQRSARIRGSG